MAGYTVKHQCDAKTCRSCRYFYVDETTGLNCCKKGYEDGVGLYAKACDDYKERHKQ